MRRLLRGFFVHILPPALAILIVVWLVKDDPPTQVFAVEALPRHAQPGEQLNVNFEGVRHRSCPVISNEEIIDSAGNHFPIQARLGNPDRETGYFNVTVKVPIPENASLGLATYRSHAVYGIDYLRGCFKTWIIGPPQRPEAKFWIGEMPTWMSRRSPQ